MNSDLITAAPPSLPPHVQLIQMGIGGWVSAVVYHAARMKLADYLADGPKDAKICKLADVLHNLRDPTETDREKKLRTGRKLIKLFGSAGRLKEPVRLLKEEMSR